MWQKFAATLKYPMSSNCKVYMYLDVIQLYKRHRKPSIWMLLKSSHRERYFFAIHLTNNNRTVLFLNFTRNGVGSLKSFRICDDMWKKNNNSNNFLSIELICIVSSFFFSLTNRFQNTDKHSQWAHCFLFKLHDAKSYGQPAGRPSITYSLSFISLFSFDFRDLFFVWLAFFIRNLWKFTR